MYIYAHLCTRMYIYVYTILNQIAGFLKFSDKSQMFQFTVFPPFSLSPPPPYPLNSTLLFSSLERRVRLHLVFFFFCKTFESFSTISLLLVDEPFDNIHRLMLFLFFYPLSLSLFLSFPFPASL